MNLFVALSANGNGKVVATFSPQCRCTDPVKLLKEVVRFAWPSEADAARPIVKELQIR